MRTESSAQGGAAVMAGTSLSRSEVTTVKSTDGAVGMQKNKWFVAYVAPRAEKKVRDSLLCDGIEAYAAVRKEIHVWRRNERRVVEKVVIPSVVFVRTKTEQLYAIQRMYNGIHAFMLDRAMKREAGRTPFAVVGKNEMEVLQAMLSQEDFEVAFTPSQFTLGEYVKVLGFDASETLAQIVRIPGDNRSYVGIRVDFLGCAYMQVPISRIVKISVNTK